MTSTSNTVQGEVIEVLDRLFWFLPDGNVADALAPLVECVEFTWDKSLTLYDKVWEPDQVAAHNAECHILSTLFFTLYRATEEHAQFLRSQGREYVFARGPIGNTVAWVFNLPKGGAQ